MITVAAGKTHLNGHHARAKGNGPKYKQWRRVEGDDWPRPCSALGPRLRGCLTIGNIAIQPAR